MLYTLVYPVSKISASTAFTCAHVPKDATHLAANAVYNVKLPMLAVLYLLL